jgi:hypothetical protein
VAAARKKHDNQMKIKQTSRARGGNRGGIGGGYERLDPDWDIKRIQRLKAEYESLDKMWKQTYLDGLPKMDQYALDRLLRPEKYA